MREYAWLWWSLVGGMAWWGRRGGETRGDLWSGTKERIGWCGELCEWLSRATVSATWMEAIVYDLTRYNETNKKNLAWTLDLTSTVTLNLWFRGSFLNGEHNVVSERMMKHSASLNWSKHKLFSQLWLRNQAQDERLTAGGFTSGEKTSPRSPVKLVIEKSAHGVGPFLRPIRIIWILGLVHWLLLSREAMCKNWGENAEM